MQKEQKLEPLAYQVDQFCKIIGIGRTAVYKLIKEGKLKTIYIGGRRLIPRSEALRLVQEGSQ
jgi:excisionase family DNA binding protein